MITLNADQLLAKNRLVEFIESDQITPIILTGSAGTGKTSTITQVITDIRELEKMDQLIATNTELYTWYFTATTNKAKQAIQKSLPNQEVSTIHSLLGLRPYRGHLTRPKNAQSKLTTGKGVIIIDECSYIDNKLLDFINELVPASIKIIYIGDANQLTPVKSDHCPVFEQGYEMIKLNTLVRQTNAPKIGQICDEFKAFIESDGQLPFPKVTLNDEITHLSTPDFLAKVEDVFITNEALTLHNRILAGTNSIVTHHNTNLFELANGRTELVAGDTVVSNNYVKGIKTDEEVIIQDKAPYSTSIEGCNGTVFSVLSMTASADVYVPDHPKKAHKKLTELIDSEDNIHSREANKLYDSFADLRPMYASTVHKAQGSTFKNVYIDLSSLSYVRDQVALARLLYVAFSRASEHIYLTGDIN